MPVKPISPDEAMASQPPIPDQVLEAFNELIISNLRGREAHVEQGDAAILIARKMGVTEDVIYANHWLDVERAYESAGWNVTYDKPGFNENYEPYFVFAKR